MSGGVRLRDPAKLPHLNGQSEVVSSQYKVSNLFSLSFTMDRVSPTSAPYGHLQAQAKAIIFNVNRYFLEEKANRGPILPPAKAMARTAKAIKISEKTVRRICSVYNQSFNKDLVPLKPTFSSPKKRHRTNTVTDFTDFDKCMLRRTVLEFYEKKEIPTVRMITEELIEKIGYSGCLNSLRKVLPKIGFKYVKIDDQKFLMERNDVVAARAKFFREMRQQKQSGRSFVYLDEVWLNQNCRVQNTSSQEATRVQLPTGKIAQLIILHAGTEDGFVSNGELIFQAKNGKMNAAVFEEWFLKQLLPNIPHNSTIVMDNAPHHSRQMEELPTLSWNKADIKNWLIQKRVAVSDDLSKAELYELTKNFRMTKKSYVVDAIAAESGHVVLRLPLYHYQYNPIETIWTQVKSYIAKTNNLELADLKPLIKEAMSAVTAEDWKQAIKRAEIEQKRDIELDRAVEMYVDSITDISESSVDEDDDDDMSE
ncbi:hypothetical protein E2C01_015619 [Portunus trituberculatus]|uniref:Tc1-like transposase DDE domain-containing protein n=1 Tax=Portunus trituberculatus TaxID=210409 RepID=A0A5B7DM25_PORTR|nr:hypothetical protein [Portunus trituberculatus]